LKGERAIFLSEHETYPATLYAVSLVFLLARTADLQVAECALVDVVVGPTVAKVANPLNNGAFCLLQFRKSGYTP
jgi:hypothetical protein